MCYYDSKWGHLFCIKATITLATLKFAPISGCIILYRLQIQHEQFTEMIGSDSPDTPRKISRINLFATSTILALIISVPAIVVTMIMYYVINTTLILTVVAGSVALFIAMGFSIKISKRLVRY